MRHGIGAWIWGMDVGGGKCTHWPDRLASYFPFLVFRALHVFGLAQSQGYTGLANKLVRFAMKQLLKEVGDNPLLWGLAFVPILFACHWLKPESHGSEEGGRATVASGLPPASGSR